MVVKKQFNDPQLNCTPFIILKGYMKVECALVEESYDLIKEADFFNNYKLMMIRCVTN